MTLSAQTDAPTVGGLLRQWRQQRRMSQLDLACEADISTRHLSFVETGRAQPSREMLLHLAEQLAMPLRERNRLLMAGGYAPVFAERSLDDPAMSAARQAIDRVLAGHEPYPALAVDRHWTLVAANRALESLMGGADPGLLKAPVNVLRLSLHPAGLAPRIANYWEWRAHILSRLRRQVEVSGDPVLAGLLDELHDYAAPKGQDHGAAVPSSHAGVIVPFELITDGGILSFISTTTIFGTPTDVTLSELALEAFFPADQVTADRLRRLAP
ncbi:helix-turn-helix transcriptional regulator [Pandoraea sp.]|uniref:helix-turn-helix domain-containing protein n=1 Tax=Pandoraea sp. TaxID=1883445 RepID=UPI0012240A01|nr:helix-turn-helix transcriptional regulator [Pandoraea sp.]TAL56257.1 MAG: XRE family transcriptional regulator [Pandoraea sp.]TAM19212.1 MAG: XRE family transcriptional regulator [Pandoraea sp.]